MATTSCPASRAIAAHCRTRDSSPTNATDERMTRTSSLTENCPPQDERRRENYLPIVDANTDNDTLEGELIRRTYLPASELACQPGCLPTVVFTALSDRFGRASVRP